MTKGPTGALNLMVRELSYQLSKFGFEPTDFRVLVNDDQWENFVEHTTGKPPQSGGKVIIKKITLGGITFERMT